MGWTRGHALSALAVITWVACAGGSSQPSPADATRPEFYVDIVVDERSDDPVAQHGSISGFTSTAPGYPGPVPPEYGTCTYLAADVDNFGGPPPAPTEVTIGNRGTWTLLQQDRDLEPEQPVPDNLFEAGDLVTLRYGHKEVSVFAPGPIQIVDPLPHQTPPAVIDTATTTAVSWAPVQADRDVALFAAFSSEESGLLGQERCLTEDRGRFGLAAWPIDLGADHSDLGVVGQRSVTFRTGETQVTFSVREVAIGDYVVQSPP